MSDTIKLIIEIPKETKQVFDKAESNDLKGGYYDHGGVIGKAIQNGIPLDSNDSDYAEAQAYFDGQAYGWKEGRKDLCDKISAEIEHEKGKWDYLSSDTCFDIAIGVVKRYEKEAEGKEVDG